MPAEPSRFSPSTKLYINISVLSIALNATYFAYLIYSDKLYDVGRCWSSPVLLLLPITEFLKHHYVRKAFQLDHMNRIPSNAGSSQIGSSATKTGTNKLHSKRPSIAREASGILFILFLSLVFYAFICLILGAPLDQYEETGSLAATLATLTIFPIALFLGYSDTLQLLFSELFELRTPLGNAYLTLLKNNCIGVILGAWGASVVAPLDWDRPWQVYPVPNVVGAIGGAFGMSIFTLCSTVYFELCSRNRKKGIV